MKYVDLSNCNVYRMKFETLAFYEFRKSWVVWIRAWEAHDFYALSWMHLKKKKYNATLFSKNWIKPRDLEKSIYFKRIVPKITLSNFKEAHEDTDLELHKSQPGFQPRGGAGRSPRPGEPWNERIRQTAWLTPSLPQRKGGKKEKNQICHDPLRLPSNSNTATKSFLETLLKGVSFKEINEQQQKEGKKFTEPNYCFLARQEMPPSKIYSSRE